MLVMNALSDQPPNNTTTSVKQVRMVARQRFRPFVLAALTAVLIGLCALLTFPFLPALAWAVALAIIAWPLHAWISHFIKNTTAAAALSAFIVTALIVATGTFVVYQIASEAASAAERTQTLSDPGGLLKKATDVPVLGPLLGWMYQMGIDVEEQVRLLVVGYAQSVSTLVEGSVEATIQFLVIVFVLYYLFRDRRTFLEGLRNLLPLSREECDRVFARAADSVHANLYATLITSLIDAVGGGFMFWLLGLPAPFVWGAVIFVLSILPVVGAGLVWFPAAVYLALAGDFMSAGLMMGWGVGSFLVVDNVVYVRLAGARMRMHPVPAMISFLGGLAVFGMSGMILGPAIVAVTEGVLELWKPRGAESRASIIQ